ncbi:hypothetical protein SSAG_00740 [Streptomyces sp. Mg1]|nr:hypothetical protein SSAG_00740 [Streptomyces sp. Mg1]
MSVNAPALGVIGRTDPAPRFRVEWNAAKASWPELAFTSCASREPELGRGERFPEAA